jgi:fumarylacetoacetase
MPSSRGIRPADHSFGVFSPPGAAPRAGAVEGDAVLDLAALAAAGLIDGLDGAFTAPVLNPFMALGPAAWAATRDALDALRGDPRADAHRHDLDGVALRMPFAVADFADFYASEHHAANLGRILRPGDEPLLPNWRRLPVGYHGRAGTVVVSGTDVVRPCGQYLGEDGEPAFGPSRRLDIELELGFVVGVPSAHGDRVPVERALEHIFGVVLLNDWSARDLQAWEYRPLGPFLGKSFATSVSAWVTPLETLRRTARGPQEPAPLPYLAEAPWGLDVALAVELNGERIAATNARELYWSPAQMIAHLTANGASLRTGDLLGSGTISGPGEDERGSLIELGWNGATRSFLADGDEVVLRGAGLGEVRAHILPAR